MVSWIGRLTRSHGNVSPAVGVAFWWPFDLENVTPRQSATRLALVWPGYDFRSVKMALPLGLVTLVPIFNFTNTVPRFPNSGTILFLSIGL